MYDEGYIDIEGVRQVLGLLLPPPQLRSTCFGRHLLKGPVGQAHLPGIATALYRFEPLDDFQFARVEFKFNLLNISTLLWQSTLKQCC